MFKFIIDFFSRVRYTNKADRIGPDLIGSQLKFYFTTSMLKTCVKKFKYFSSSSEIRPGVIVSGCSKISLGKRVVLRPLTMLYADNQHEGGEIIIENDVMLGAGVHIYTDRHKYQDITKPIIDQGFDNAGSVIIRKGSWLGAKVVICPGVEIGENCVIGAGSVVTKSLPSNTLCAGNPAKIIKKLK